MTTPDPDRTTPDPTTPDTPEPTAGSGDFDRDAVTAGSAAVEAAGSGDAGEGAGAAGSGDASGGAGTAESAEAGGDVGTAESAEAGGDAGTAESAEAGEGAGTAESDDTAGSGDAGESVGAGRAGDDGGDGGVGKDAGDLLGDEGPVGDEGVLDDATMRRALEAILMVTDEPMPVLTLSRAVGRATNDVAAALGELAAEYTEQGRGFDLREVGGGWRYYTRAEAAPYVERFVLDGQQARLTQAALETLAVVAYKQPVSRARVSAIRGVNVDGVMRTLVARGLVEEAGSDTESQATLYRTTSYFLERMGMQSLDDLPELAPYLPEMDDIEDELAAQSLPPTTPTESDSTDTGSTDAEPVDADATDAESLDASADSDTADGVPAEAEPGDGVPVASNVESTDESAADHGSEDAESADSGSEDGGSADDSEDVESADGDSGVRYGG